MAAKSCESAAWPIWIGRHNTTLFALMLFGLVLGFWCSYTEIEEGAYQEDTKGYDGDCYACLCTCAHG